MRHRPIRNALARVLRAVPGEWGRRPRPTPLIECLACGSDRVCVIDFEEDDDCHWWIRLRCGECEIWRDVIVSDAEAAELDRALVAHATAMRSLLAALDRERMAAEIEVLVAALERDLIDPSSFAT
jgi:hypothetical protein